MKTGVFSCIEILNLLSICTFVPYDTCTDFGFLNPNKAYFHLYKKKFYWAY
jgi:hypothetical protein